MWLKKPINGEWKCPQFEILVRHMGYFTEKDGFCMNPFYRGVIDSVIENYDYAKEIYAMVFKQFICMWYIQYELKRFKHIPPKEWEIFPQKEALMEIKYG